MTNLRSAAFRLGRKFGFDIRRFPSDQHSRLLRRLIQERQISICVDVGAHEGGFASRLRNDVKFRGRIVSVEPDPASFARLEEHFRHDTNWQGLQQAVAVSEGPVLLYRYGNSQFQSLLRPSQAGRDYSRQLGSDLGEIEVSSVTLPQLIRSVVSQGEKCLLKIDTQGMDLSLLETCSPEDLRPVAAIQCEVPWKKLYEGSRDFVEYRDLLSSQGYLLAGLFSVGSDSRTFEVVEFDMVAVRRED